MITEATTYHQLREHLAYLKLGAVAEQLAAALQQAKSDKPSYTQLLHDLLAVEVQSDRATTARRPPAVRELPRAQDLEQRATLARPAAVDELTTLRFVQEKANVLLIGPPGVGKTMLATALGLKAINAGYRIYYTTAATSSRARPAPRSKAAGRPPCASGRDRKSS
jgi:DNA replication protein DnaC